MHGGHQAVGDAELIIQNLGDGGQAVGGAGGVGHEGHVGGIGIQVDAAHEHGGVVLGGGGHDDLLGAGVDMALSLLLGQEQTGGLHHVLRAQLTPGNVGGVALGVDGDLLAVDHDGVLGGRDLTLELAVHGVVLQHIGQIVSGAQVVDAHDLNVGMVDAGTEDHTADPAKPVNTNFDAHWNSLLIIFGSSLASRGYIIPHTVQKVKGFVKIFSKFSALFTHFPWSAVYFAHCFERLPSIPR